MKTMQALFLSAALTATVLAGGCKESASDKAFGMRVRTYLLAHPEVLEETIAALDAKKAAAMMEQQNKDVAKIRAAIPSHRAALERDPMDYVANPNGRVTVTQFFDFRCGHCKNIAPHVIQLIAENPDVRFVFKDMPIFGNESDMAAALALAAKQQNKYLSLYEAFFSANALSGPQLQPLVAEAGLNYEELYKKAVDPAIARHILATRKLAKEMGIEGTPHFIVGNDVIVGEKVDELRLAIAKAKAAA